MKTKALIRLFAVLMLPVIMGCSCLANSEPDPNVVCKGDYSAFLDDLLDNGHIDYAGYSCGTPLPPTPTPGWNIPASNSKQPPCTMQWLSSTAVPVNGAYDLNVSPQQGATSYEFFVTYPDGTQVMISSNSSDATLLMNDLPSGSYTVDVYAKDFMGKEICSITAGFTRPAPGFALNSAPACEMQFVLPASGSTFPFEGPVDFVWTQQSSATSYVLDFILPNGNHGTMEPTASLSRTVYMEAFTPGGTYTVFVKALNAESNMICQVSISFTKPEYPSQKLAKPPQHNGDESVVPTEQSLFIPIIVLHFTPTPEIPR